MGNELRSGRWARPWVQAAAVPLGLFVAFAMLAVVFLVLLPALLLVGAVMAILAVGLPCLVVATRVAKGPLRGNGEAAGDARNVPAFHGVCAAGAMDVEITCGKAPGVTISADRNLLEHIRTQVSDGVLEIRLSREVRAVSPLRVEVTTDRLDQLALAGALRVSAGGIDTEGLSVAVSGACRLRLEGRCNDAAIRLTGSTELDARDLTCRAVRVEVRGAARATVHAEDRLSADAEGAAHVECLGKPADVEKRTQGAASITVR